MGSSCIYGDNTHALTHTGTHTYTHMHEYTSSYILQSIQSDTGSDGSSLILGTGMKERGSQGKGWEGEVVKEKVVVDPEKEKPEFKIAKNNAKYPCIPSLQILF